MNYVYASIATGFLGILYSLYQTARILRLPPGSQDMVEIAEAIKEDFNEIIAVYNKPSGFYVGKSFKIFHRIMSLFLPPAISKLLNRYESKTRKLQELISQNHHVTVIRPKTQIPLRSILDTNKARLNATISSF